MNTPRARHPVIPLLLCITLLPACGVDPPADTVDTASTAGTTGDSTSAPTDMSTTTGAPATTGQTTDAEATTTSGTTGPGSSSTGDGSTGGGDEPVVLGNTKSCPASGQASPDLPEEAGQLAATVLTPEVYPFEVTSVTYAMVQKLNLDCVSTLAHRVEVSVIDGDTPLSNPSADAPAFASIAIDESLEELPLRILEPKLDPPLVLQEGQSLVVSVSLEADVDANVSLCLDTCVGDATIGVDFWSQAAAEPYDWLALKWKANFKLYAIGRPL